MATLKISDLSVGDWVRYKGKEYTIASIYVAAEGYPHEVALTYQGICCGCAYIDYLEPIPITAEILEKNGWKLSKSNWFEFEDGEWKINIWIGKSKCNIEISQKREIYAYTYADIQVVKSNINTLQHALRFAGIDKEINL